MSPEAGPHGALLRAGRDLQGRALTHDDTGLRDDLHRFRAVLLAHLEEEAEALARLPDASRMVLERGHDNLLALTDSLIESATHRELECVCHVRVVDLTRAVARQARLEGDMLAGR